MGENLKGTITGFNTYHTDAYMIAVRNGFDGTEAEWLESLKGEQGVPGEKGEKGDPGIPDGAILYTEQSLTGEQQTQARVNIGAVDYTTVQNEVGFLVEALTSDVVRYSEQTLTEDQKAQARVNIGAAAVGEGGGGSGGGVDSIVEQQHNNTGVCYRKWASGFVELWVYEDIPYQVEGGFYNIPLPVNLVGKHNGRTMVHCSAMTTDHTSIPVYTDIMDNGNGSELTMIFIHGDVPMDGTVRVNAYITGFWK